MSAPGPPNIYIVGAQGTGKTTLVNELERQYQSLARNRSIDEPRVISEVAREVLKKHPIKTKLIRSDPQESLNLQMRILTAQVQAEEQALVRGSWFISDRSGFDPIVYARRHASPESADEMLRSADWLALEGRMAASLVVVCEAGAEWPEDDGVRLMPKDREDWIRLHGLFCEMLDEVGLGFCVLPATTTILSEPVDFVLSAWRQ